MIVGILQVFNEVNWIGFAIDQAMMWCDKLLIIEGSQFVAYPDIPERSDDGTLDIINDKAKEYSKRIKIFNTIRKHQNYRQNQCENFNVGLSHCRMGDYFVQLDADEFFLSEWIEEAKQLMKEGIDFIYTSRRNFAFNFTWQIKRESERYRPVIGRKIKNFKFIPTKKWSGINKNQAAISIIGQFHYIWVKPPGRLMIRARTSRHNMANWHNETWMNIEPRENCIYSLAYYGTFTLHKYKGEHPPILDDHPWRHIEDVRKL